MSENAKASADKWGEIGRAAAETAIKHFAVGNVNSGAHLQNTARLCAQTECALNGTQWIPCNENPVMD